MFGFPELVIVVMGVLIWIGGYTGYRLSDLIRFRAFAKPAGGAALVRLLRALRREGVLGINRRNHEFTLRWNPRRMYPLVDDKLETKRLCEAAGIPIPALIAVARHQGDVRGMVAELAALDEFVLKPAHGAMGNGILVVRGREGARWRRAGGRPLTEEDLRYHAASIISGMYCARRTAGRRVRGGAARGASRARRDRERRRAGRARDRAPRRSR